MDHASTLSLRHRACQRDEVPKSLSSELDAVSSQANRPKLGTDCPYLDASLRVHPLSALTLCAARC